MNRPPSSSSPVFSPVSIAIALVFLFGLGIFTWRRGGSAFNPGAVTSRTQPGLVLANFRSHADFENQCNTCHQPFQTSQAALCTACHQEVGIQIDQKVGTHGVIREPGRCRACHAEHRGPTFDPVQTALETFDHGLTRMPLTGKHARIECSECHKGEQPYRLTQTNCSACHGEPEQHAGMFGNDCAACHSTESWKPARWMGTAFDHEKTGFSLARHAKTDQGIPYRCTLCHNGAPQTFQTGACIDCHQQRDAGFTAKHRDQYGDGCIECHDGADRMHGFQHDVVFPLDGKHAGLECAQCHADKQFHSLSKECSSCHQDPEIHRGFFGLKCALCHTTEAWRPAFLRAHGFPLVHGGQGETGCKTCHSGAYSQYTCYGCHEHNPDEIAKTHARAGIASGDLPRCTTCHADGKTQRETPVTVKGG